MHKNNYKLAASYSFRGNTYIALGSFDLAILDLTKSLEKDPDNADAYWWRGLANHKKGYQTRPLQILIEREKLILIMLLSIIRNTMGVWTEKGQKI